MKRYSCVGLTALFLAAIIVLSPCASADPKKAATLYQQGKYSEAMNELRPDYDKNPDWEFGHRLMGLCYLGLNSNKLALQELSRAVELKSEAFATYYGLAEANYKLKKFDDGISALDKAEQRAAEAEKAKVYKFRGSIYYEMKKYNEALNDLTKVQPDFKIYNILGDCYFKLNRINDGVQALEKALAMKDDASIRDALKKVYFKQGTDALRKNDWETAIKDLLKAHDYDKKDGSIFFYLGEAYLQQKPPKYKEAEEALTQAAALMPKPADALQRLGIIYENTNRPDRALEVYKKMDPSTKGVAEGIARVYIKQGTDGLSGGRFDAAIAAFLEAKKYTPNDGNISHSLGEAYLQLKPPKYKEAEEALTQAAALMPDNADVMQSLGFACENQKTPKGWDCALDAYNKALKLTPKTMDIYQHLGFIYETLKKWDQALDVYKKASAIDPKAKWIKEAIDRVNENKKAAANPEPKK
jgi:tetratricopeptide (TPR) repeat protein